MDRKTIEKFLHTLVSTSSSNRLDTLDGPFFTTPLIGFAAADDDLFLRFHEIIGEFHLTPQQWLAITGQSRFTGGTVISWVLPISSEIRISNRTQQLQPSRAWALTRNDGEQFNNLIRDQLVALLQQSGHLAIAPLRHAQWRALEDAKVGLASNWSERHAAYVAGLGTFSLNDGLITTAGIAHRCGSVITDLVLPPDQRVYAGAYDYCLYQHAQRCGACIRRCPVGAITQAGHDKTRCRDYTYGALQARLQQTYGVAICGCGLCQTKVPCEACKPGLE